MGFDRYASTVVVGYANGSRFLIYLRNCAAISFISFFVRTLTTKQGRGRTSVPFYFHFLYF